MNGYSYVYILQSEQNSSKHYTGLTDDLEDRLGKHNKGDVVYTSKYRPWRLRVAVAFDDRKHASSFEAYLKTHSGRVFASRHF